MVGHVFSFALCTSDVAAFAHVVSPGVGAFPNFIVARGLGSSVPQDNPWAFGTRVFERWRVYQEGRGLCQSQNFPPKESNRCIKLRGKYYIVFNFLRERKQGVFAQQKAENCSFVQKRRNFVTRVLVVYVVTGHYKVTFSYENKTKT